MYYAGVVALQHYEYIDDLLALDACRPSKLLFILDVLCSISTPLKLAAWSLALASHPDVVFAQYIVSGIANGFCISFDRNATLSSLGVGSLLAKVDIESPYRVIPVHQEDRQLLGVMWRDQCFCDGMLPFGLRSAPKLFTAFADALEWCIRQEGVENIYHYLDDFIVVGPPCSSQCQTDLDALERTCFRLGVPLAAHKQEGPTTKLTFTGY